MTTTNETSVRALLDSSDREVEAALQVLPDEGATERVRTLAELRRLVSVHDAVLASVLVPVLDGLPEGAPVAERLRQGCAERSDLIQRFQKAVDGVAVSDVYPVSGREIEAIIDDLTQSFRRHEREENAAVTAVLQPGAGPDTAALADRMALAARQAPTRSHDVRAHTGWRQRLYHYADALHDWSDAHHGWGPMRRR